MGFCNGAKVEVVRRAPLGDPIEFRLRGYHLSLRGGARPAERYLDRFDQIRKLQRYLVERARASGKPVIDAANLDSALGVALELVREAVGAELRSR